MECLFCGICVTCGKVLKQCKRRMEMLYVISSIHTGKRGSPSEKRSFCMGCLPTNQGHNYSGGGPLTTTLLPQYIPTIIRGSKNNRDRTKRLYFWIRKIYIKCKKSRRYRIWFFSFERLPILLMQGVAGDQCGYNSVTLSNDKPCDLAKSIWSANIDERLTGMWKLRVHYLPFNWWYGKP